MQGDFGREHHDHSAVKSTDEGNLRPAPTQLQTFLNKLQGPIASSKLQQNTRTYLKELISLSKISIPEESEDILFESHYLDKHRLAICSSRRCNASSVSTCVEAKDASCVQLEGGLSRCSRSRTKTVSDGPTLHFGSISSTDTIKKNGISRDRFASEHKVVAFEMEGAGV